MNAHPRWYSALHLTFEFSFYFLKAWSKLFFIYIILHNKPVYTELSYALYDQVKSVKQILI